MESDQAAAVQGARGSRVRAGVVTFSRRCNEALMLPRVHNVKPVKAHLISDGACRIFPIHLFTFLLRTADSNH